MKKKKNNEVDINDFIEILRQGYIISLGEDKNAKQFEEISTEVEKIYMGSDLIYQNAIDYSKEYFTIEPLADGTITFTNRDNFK